MYLVFKYEVQGVFSAGFFSSAKGACSECVARYPFNKAIADPGEFGFTNVTDSCRTESSVCANPDEYLFWDDIHPTTAAHELVGELAFSALEPEPIPEPSAELGLLALGALGTVSVLKRKKKKTSPVKSSR